MSSPRGEREPRARASGAPTPISDILASLPLPSRGDAGEPCPALAQGWTAEERERYELTHWLPVLGPTGYGLVMVLRMMARPRWLRECPWAVCEASGAILARALGVSRRTIQRVLQRDAMRPFVTWRVVRQRSGQGGARGVYRVLMETPLLPSHVAVLAAAETAGEQPVLPPGEGAGASAGGAWRQFVAVPGDNVVTSAEGAEGQFVPVPGEKVVTSPGAGTNCPSSAVSVGCNYYGISNHADRLREQLAALGVRDGAIARLLRSYDHRYLAAQLDQFGPGALRARNPAGYIRRAIEAGWRGGAPPGPAPARQAGGGAGAARGMAETLLESLPQEARQALEERARDSLRRELGDRVPVPEGAVRARVLRWLGAESQEGDPAVAPTPLVAPLDPADAPTRFLRWAAVRIGGRGGALPRGRARRVVWLAMRQMGAGVREIARATGVTHAAVARGLSQCGEPEREAAKRLREEFEAALEAIVGVGISSRPR
jgi:hypothetical protein